MKTYSSKDYNLRHPFSTFPKDKDWITKYYSGGSLCHCVLSGGGYYGKPRAWEECGFCLGKGTVPIPWSELI